MPWYYDAISKRALTMDEDKEEKKSKKAKCKEFMYRYLPISEWLPKYKFKEYIVGDLMAGLTLGCLHVPQALAFSMLAHASPQMGLYTSCFSVLVYCLFGTAVVSSYGPVSISCLLTGKIVMNNQDSNYTNDEIATVITFSLGVIYCAAFLLRFGVVTKLFTKQLSSAFVTGSALQVVFSTLKTVLGIKSEECHGYFSVIFEIYHTFKGITETNFVTLGISTGVIVVFTLNQYVIRPAMAKNTKVILPIEMITIIIVTMLSYFLELDTLGVTVMGYVPTGFPDVVLPKFTAFPLIWGQALLIAIVNYATSITMAIMFNPGLRSDQELLALGLANVICCPFQTLPMGNSMMRSMVAKSLGINTLLSDIFSCILVLMTIMFMGPLFQPMPVCVLGCIIIFGLTLLIVSQFIKLPEVIKSGWENSIIWFLTLLITFFISVELGLLIGLCLTLRQFLSSVNDKKTDEIKQDDPEPPPVTTPPSKKN